MNCSGGGLTFVLLIEGMNLVHKILGPDFVVVPDSEADTIMEDVREGKGQIGEKVLKNRCVFVCVCGY